MTSHEFALTNEELQKKIKEHESLKQQIKDKQLQLIK